MFGDVLNLMFQKLRIKLVIQKISDFYGISDEAVYESLQA